MATLDEIYTAEWVAHDFADLQLEFDVVAQAIYRQFRPETAIDVGCGPGMVVDELRILGVDASGYEGSSHVVAYANPLVRPFITHADITTLEDLGAADLVICTEVAEHLDETDAEGLVALLCSSMSPIVFTAAPPGQEGHHHVNCQPRHYWVDLFRGHGVRFDNETTIQLAARWGSLRRLSHMINNLMVFR